MSRIAWMESMRLTGIVDAVREEIGEAQVRRWSREEIERMWPDGYPPELLAKGRLRGGVVRQI